MEAWGRRRRKRDGEIMGKRESCRRSEQEVKKRRR